jgi:mono/diheme cytochrome c family protein
MSTPDHPAQARENADPVERTNPIPLFVAAIASVVLFFGAGYLLFSESFGSSQWGDRRTLADLSGAPAAGGAAADGKVLFASNCAACHQATGQGLPGVFPPLAGSEWVIGDPRTLAHILVFGVNGEMQVKGNVYNGNMPAFAQLNDAELAALASHIRSNWSNQAAPVTVEAIAQARTTKRSTPFEGGKELHALPPLSDAGK